MRDTTAAVEAEPDNLGTLERAGKRVVIVGTESELLGAIAIADEVRPASKRAVARLQELGVERVVMPTGECRQVGVGCHSSLHGILR